jgi:hypothetical protein
MRKLTRNEKYALTAFTLILALVVYLYVNRPVVSDVAEIHYNAAFIGSVLQSPAVVFRIVYPFSNVQGAGQSMVFASNVVTYKRKAIILQTVDGNSCLIDIITPDNAAETNRPTPKTIPAEQCYAYSQKYPTIEIKEGEAKLDMTPVNAEITGNSHQVYVLTKYLLTKIYPDAEKVFIETQKVLAATRR